MVKRNISKTYQTFSLVIIYFIWRADDLIGVPEIKIISPVAETSIVNESIIKLEGEIKRYYYKGKPTRKYKRLIKMNRKLEYDLMKIGGLLGK